MGGVPLSLEAGRAFQAESTLGKKWEGCSAGNQGGGQAPRGSMEAVREGARPRWPGSLVERSQAARSRGNLGSLQLEVQLRDETVLPSGCYQPLVQLLCREVKLGTQVRGPRGKVGGSRDSRPVLPVLLNLL